LPDIKLAEKPPIGWLFCVWEKGKSPKIGLCGPCYKKSAIYGVRRNANGRKFAYFSAASHHPLKGRIHRYRIIATTPYFV
ncbi:TPA: hypothetical protein ACS7ZU_002915, partial [Providencia alcalifaciens]